MSTSSGGRTRAQAHQNRFAFHHNKNSKKTREIAAKVTVDDLCAKCAAKIEWRVQYRKYKMLTQPRRCNICQEKNVKKAYRTLCEGCAKEKQCCPQCAKDLEKTGKVEQEKVEKVAEEDIGANDT